MRKALLVLAAFVAMGVIGVFLLASDGPDEPPVPPVVNSDGTLSSPPEFQADEGNSSITVDMSDIRNSDGNVKITLFDTSEGYPEDTGSVAEYAYSDIVDGKASCKFEGIAAGTYAIIILHDEDQDGDMTFNAVGIPKEGVGVSNNAKMKFGPPKWEDSKFEVPESGATQSIKMTYFL